MQDYLSLGIMVVIGVCTFFGLIWGLIRGLKKTVFRLSWVLVTAVILMFVTPSIVTGLLEVDVSFLNIDINGTVVVTLQEAIEVFAQTDATINGILTGAPEAVNIVVAIISLFINAIVYVVLFWLAKIILWPLWAILSAVIIKKRTVEGIVKKKYRGWGALTGVVFGFLISVTTLMPVVGVLNTVNTINEDYKNEVNANGIFDEFGLNEYEKYFTDYFSGAANGILKYTGGNLIANGQFDYLSSAEISGTEITLEGELRSIVFTVGTINTITSMTAQDITQENLTEILDKIDVLIEQVFNINSVTTLMDTLLPVIVDEILTNPDFFIQLPQTGNTTYDEAIKDVITSLKDLNNETLEQQLIATVNIAKILNDNGVLHPMVTGQQLPTEDLYALLGNGAAEQIFNEISSVDLIMTNISVLFNVALDYTAQQLGITDIVLQEGVETLEEMKALFNNVTGSIIDVYNSLDFDSQIIVTNNTLPHVGAILDDLKNFSVLRDEDYIKIVNKLEAEISKQLDSVKASMASPEFDAIIAEVELSISKLSHIESFEAEFEKLKTAPEILNGLINAYNSNDGKEIFSLAGQVLDVIKTTELFKDTFNNIAKAGIDFGIDLLGSTNAELINLANDLKINIENVTSFQTEFELLYQTSTLIESAINATDVQAFIKANNYEFFTDLGIELDKLKESELLGNLLNDVVVVAVDLLSSSATLDTFMTDLLTTVKNNVTSAPDTLSWQTEFTNLKNLASAAFDYLDGVTTLESLGAALDTVKANGGFIVNAELINTAITKVLDDQIALQTNIDIQNLLNEIKYNISSITSYQAELAHLQVLLDTSEEVKTIDISTYDFASLGATLDGWNNSALLANIRPNLIIIALDFIDTTGMDADTINIIGAIKVNAQNNIITSYTDELTYLKEALDLVNTNNEFTDYALVGATLDGWNDSALLQYIRTDIIRLALNNVETAGWSANEIAVLDKIKLNAQDGMITSYQTEFAKLGDALDLVKAVGEIANYAQFGADLDNLDSTLLANARGLMVASGFERISITTADANVNAVIDSIISNVKNEANLIAAGTLAKTYATLFSELSTLEASTQSVSNATFTETDYDLSTIATDLETLKAISTVGSKNSYTLAAIVLQEMQANAAVFIDPLAQSSAEYIELQTLITTSIDNFNNFTPGNAEIDITTVFADVQSKITAALAVI